MADDDEDESENIKKLKWKLQADEGGEVDENANSPYCDSNFNILHRDRSTSSTTEIVSNSELEGLSYSHAGNSLVGNSSENVTRSSSSTTGNSPLLLDFEHHHLSESDFSDSKSFLSKPTRFKCNIFEDAHVSSHDLLDGSKFDTRLKDLLFGETHIPHIPTTYAVNFFGRSFFSKKKSNEPANDNKVQFTSEAVEKYNVTGDVAGKERIVKKLAKKPRKQWRKMADVKDHGEIVYNNQTNTRGGDSFSDTSEDYSCDDCFFCMKKLYPEAIPTPGSLSTNYRIQVDNFAENLDSAGYYFEGNTKTINGAVAVFLMPFKQPLTYNVNHLAAKVWLFTYSLRILFSRKHHDNPTREELTRLMKQFQTLQEECEKTCESVKGFETIFLLFEKKILREVKRLTSRFNLKLNKQIKRNIQKDAQVPLKSLVCPNNNSCTREEFQKEENFLVLILGDWYENDPEWTSLTEYSLHFRYAILLNLIEESIRAIQIVRAHIQFLMEDVQNGKFEPEDAHIYTVLGSMNTIIAFFLRSPETVATHEKNLRQAVQSFTKDAMKFLRKANYVIRNFYELNETVFLCKDYMVDVFKDSNVDHLPFFEDKDIGNLPITSRPSTTPKLGCGAWIRHLFRSRQPQKNVFYQAKYRRILQMFYVNTNHSKVMLRYSPELPKSPVVRLSDIEAVDDDETIYLIQTVVSDTASSDTEMNAQSEVQVITTDVASGIFLNKGSGSDVAH